MSVIEIENLVKKYGDNIAVNNLSLNIEKGHVYGFLGPNGAGKSTTMNIITGYIGASQGCVRIDGHDILKEPELAKKCMGYLPELPPLYQEMTVREYLSFVAELKQIPKKEREENIINALEMTKTNQVENRLIKNLSKGYKQRVGIAQALIGMPEVIILDEPTVGLDPKQIIEIRQLIRELGKNHTVILSSHILTEISEVCDYIYIISQGQLAACGTEQELVEQMAGENHLDLEIVGDKEEVEKILDRISKIEKYEFSYSDKEGVANVTVFSNRENDVREELFFTFADARMPIINMSFKQKTLEDIFIELTKEYIAPEKKKGFNLRFKKDITSDESVDEMIDVYADDNEEVNVDDVEIAIDVSDDSEMTTDVSNDDLSAENLSENEQEEND